MTRNNSDPFNNRHLVESINKTTAILLGAQAVEGSGEAPEPRTPQQQEQLAPTASDSEPTEVQWKAAQGVDPVIGHQPGQDRHAAEAQPQAPRKPDWMH